MENQISIHALREESDAVKLVFRPERKNFNPRSPRGERPLQINSTASCSHFNPRSPRGERPNLASNVIPLCTISIHALREESDLQKSRFDNLLFDFNPRSPRGERLSDTIDLLYASIFQSTLSARRATYTLHRYCRP